MLATAGALSVSSQHQQRRADNLEIAQRNSREIGIAIGILMAQHKVTREAGVDLLRLVSQATDRKLHDLASEVADTGVLPALRDLQPSRRRPDAT